MFVCKAEGTWFIINTFASTFVMLFEQATRTEGRGPSAPSLGRGRISGGEPPPRQLRPSSPSDTLSTPLCSHILASRRLTSSLSHIQPHPCLREVRWSTSAALNVYRVGNGGSYDLVFASPVRPEDGIEALLASEDGDDGDMISGAVVVRRGSGAERSPGLGGRSPAAAGSRC